MTIESDVKQRAQKAIERLTTLRDEAKLRVHLASLDAQETFRHLERQVGELETRANREGERAIEGIKTAAQELTRELNEFMTSQVNSSVGLLTSARSLMTTHVCTCRADDSLSHAAHLLWEHDCGILPVLSYDRVVGMLTDRDICMATYTQGKAPGELRVDSAMSTELFCCGPDESVGSVLAIMSDKRVRRIPVVDADGKLIGVLALADLARWARSLTNPAVDSAVVEALAAISASSQSSSKVAA